MIKKFTSKLIVLFCFGLLLTMVFPVSVTAESTFQTYNYTTDKQEMASPDIYTVSNVVYGALLPCNTFKEAQDLFVDAQDRIYVVDSYNARIILFDENYNYVKELSTFLHNGETLTLASGAEGVFFNDKTNQLYIADTNNDRIIVCDRDGNVSNVFKKPESPVLDKTVEYKPSKIIVDNNKNMYVLSNNVNTGALMMDLNNEFLGFYGINPVKENALMKAERLWKKLLGTSEYSFQPVAVNNLFRGEDTFIYSVSTRNKYLESEVCKLNALGDNVFKSTDFGDLSENAKTVELFDISVDSNGFFSVLDRYNGKIYCYDNESNLIGAFGGIGEQVGQFKIPNALSYNSRGELIVLDAEKNNLTVFKRTEYAEKVFAALTLYSDGRYKESLEPLDSILKINTNFNLLYTAKGKADVMLQEYSKAMSDFKFGNDQENYSSAKQQKRDAFIKSNFTAVVIFVVIFVLCLVFIDKVMAFIKTFTRRIYRGKKK